MNTPAKWRQEQFSPPKPKMFGLPGAAGVALLVGLYLADMVPLEIVIIARARVHDAPFPKQCGLFFIGLSNFLQIRCPSGGPQERTHKKSHRPHTGCL
jgi:hypothetical protein